MYNIIVQFKGLYTIGGLEVPFCVVIVVKSLQTRINRAFLLTTIKNAIVVRIAGSRINRGFF